MARHCLVDHDEHLVRGVCPSSKATDQNAFIVTKDFSTQKSLTTLSDLPELGQPIELAAPSDCDGRPACEAGLKNVYGINIIEIVLLDFASTQMKAAVTAWALSAGERDW